MNRARRRLVLLVVVLVVLVGAGFGAVRIRANLAVPDPGAEVASVTDDATDLDSAYVARDGDDYARMEGDVVLVCDGEADDNLVKVVVVVPDGDDPVATRRIEVADERGADGRCASVTVRDHVVNLWVCERNVVAWHCSNAVLPAVPD